MKKISSGSKKSKGRVFVGISGGVDSSVSATLLQKEGYEVTGVFMKVWQPDFLPCTWREERLDAMRVCAHLGIQLLTWDFEREYKDGVADYMINEYRAGRTPNPDVMCNREVKFGSFFRRAISGGADFIATGHYAQATLDKKNDVFVMKKGVDDAKDQSYFLWTLGQEQLSKTLFPIGGYKKSQVRALARKFGLPVAEKKDSQGLCFVGKLDMKDFLAHFIDEKEGSVLDETGETIGMHRGAYFYTLGERHGFTVTKKGADDAPYYVVAKDLTANTITVARQTKKYPESARKDIKISQINFCRGILPDTKKTYTAQVRYHGEKYECKITDLVYVQDACPDFVQDVNLLIQALVTRQLIRGTFSLHFKKPVIADAGQSVVLYDCEKCLGGGIIE
ncbi:MAG: tRNA 2-thiouridine(34) synthase MnmA [Candidatus Yonathbacteria bacterium]|nr:tRNA 2-thiouridine(34) synthase MnmA [Candidatus Yonathbacteria bacterium]